jgi:hypothetical protein
MKKSKHGVIRLTVNLQIIKSVSTRRKPFTLETLIGARADHAQKCRRPVTEQNTVTKLVDRMLQVEAT